MGSVGDTFAIIDAHNHVGDLSSMAGSGAPPDPDFELARRLRTLDARGVDQAIVIASHFYLRPDGIQDTQRINDQIAAYRGLRPDRFPAAVGIVEPVYGERGLAEIDRCKNELGLAGISFHTRFQGVSIDSEWVRRYLRRMEELELVPFIHCFGESSEEALWQIDTVADEFPTLKILVLDAFSTGLQGRFLPTVAKRHENLLFDTATFRSMHYIDLAIREVGASRFVYGSDLYSWPHDERVMDPLPLILASDFDDEQKTAILGTNLAALLRL